MYVLPFHGNNNRNILAKRTGLTMPQTTPFSENDCAQNRPDIRFFNQLSKEFIDTTTSVMPVKTLRGEVRRALHTISRTVKWMRTHPSKSGEDTFAEWLGDNYHLLAREGAGLMSALKFTPKIPHTGRFPVLYLLLRKLVSSDELPSQESFEVLIDVIQQTRPLTVFELEHFSVCLRAALIITAAEACASKKTDGHSHSERLISLAVNGLRGVVGLDFEGLTERHSVVEQLLRDDPSGTYPLMDEKSRSDYRRCVALTAQRVKRSEQTIAEEFVHKAQQSQTTRDRHIGAHMTAYGQRESRRTRGRVMLVCTTIIPAVAAIFAGTVLRSAAAALLLYFPLAELSRPLIQQIFSYRITPVRLPRLELNGIIPEEGRTVLAVSTLLPAAASARKTARHMHNLWNTNGQGAVQICLLTDLPQAEYPTMPQDSTDIAAIRREVVQLNKRYGNHFILAVRPREHTATMQAYTGKERKRGAITELIRVIRGGETAFCAFEGDMEQLRRAKYLLALDADTGMLLDTAAALVGTALHPLVKPELSHDGRRVTTGYGILSPRLCGELSSANKTAFARAMAGVGGVTPYDIPASDLYMDCFSSSIFTGKGLINIEAFSVLEHSEFPPEQVLSHDILEGCMLRTGLVSDVEMADGFPSAMGGWLDRLHRWIRGDWQNVTFLTGKALPLTKLDKWKLYDNLRRAVTPVTCLLCLLISPLMSHRNGSILALIALLSPVTGNLLSAIMALIHGGWMTLGGKYYSRVLPRALGTLTQALYSLIMLPAIAITGLDATVRALTRLITRRKMLEWTTAAQAEKRKQGAAAVIKRLWPTLVIAAVLIVWGGGFIRLGGMLFALLIPLAIYSGRANSESSDRPYLSPGQNEQVSAYAAAMWRYYEERCTAEEHYLPPDNVQESPVWRIAHRTSPTNIGLYLLCIAAAHDLGLIDDDGMLTRMERTITTVDRLEKWNGNLLNWYDTTTLRPLMPRYVSTVDSGNFACCMTALRQKLLELKNGRAEALAQRVWRFNKQTDMTPLYDKTRSLFHIGLDPDSGKRSPSYYDLLMSESRMTGYYCIATRAIPKKHWGALGRTLTRSGNAVGPISWTGTMFEYFMPRLLLPAEEGSMSYEALRFCLHCQRRRSPGGVWGISESGFYAFDGNLNYQYKAHGVPRLALKRGLGHDLVISPYSSFITLTTDADSALRNLKRLERFGMTGSSGFYEAADFTPDRAAVGGRAIKGNFSIVRSYMAHHVGMSMVACANAMLGDVFVRRFMRDEDMSRAAELCCEKAPTAGTVFEPSKENETPQVPGRAPAAARILPQSNPRVPHMHLLAGAEWQLAVTDNGAGVSSSHGMDIHRVSEDLLRNPQGIFAFIDDGSGAFSITSAPEYLTAGTLDLERETEFTPYSAIFTAKTGRLEAGMRAAVHPRLPGEQRQIVVKNRTGHRMNATVLFYFEPSLARRADATAHPAFSRIFLAVEKDDAAEALIVTRRRRSGEAPLCLAVGMLDGQSFEYQTNRDTLLTRPHGIASAGATVRMPFHKAGSGAPDCTAALRVHLELPPHAQRSAVLILAAGPTRADAVRRLIKMRTDGLLSDSKAATTPFGGVESELAARVLPDLFFPHRMSREWCEAARSNRGGIQELWALGISGDYPIVLLEIHNAADTCRAEPYMRLHRSLRLGGITTELVIAFREGGAYDAPVMDAIRDAARDAGCLESLAARGGIHAVNLMIHSEEILSLLTAVCVHNGARDIGHAEMPPAEYSPTPTLPVQPWEQSPSADNGQQLPVPGGVFIGDSFRVTAVPSLPWCHIISNPTFGTLVSDMSLGYTWAVNSRENKLTPWQNDTVTDNRGEMLLLRAGGKIWDTVCGSRTEYGCGYARYYGRADGINTTVTVRVPPRGMWKTVELTMENTGSEEMEIQTAYYTEPVLGVDRKHARHTVAGWENGSLLLYNPFRHISGTAILTAQGGADGCDCDRGSFLCGRWSGGTLSPLPDPCAAIVVRRKLPPRRKEKVTFVLGFAQGETASRIAALRIPALSSVIIPQTESLPHINTPDLLLNAMANSWLPRQLLHCRIYARTGFYQCGGAWGFRDQLQDSLGALWISPVVTRRQIIRCAAVQFVEGDVLHWWYRLPGSLRGVRTTCSDDLVWLPYATSYYTDFTGDLSILDVETPWISGEPLETDEHDRYFNPGTTSYKDTVYEHCIRALDRACTRGAHGLPLIGGGDWNDGFSLVGAQGQGESVWLAMFLAMTLKQFSALCDMRNDRQRAEDYRRIAEEYLAAAENCFSDDRYIRAYYDDGTPIGVPGGDDVCTIDSLAQSFSVLAGMPAEWSATALDTAMRLLVDREHGIVKLLAPPFNQEAVKIGDDARSPGYIAAYPPGMRENGGQYTHVY